MGNTISSLIIPLFVGGVAVFLLEIYYPQLPLYILMGICWVLMVITSIVCDAISTATTLQRDSVLFRMMSCTLRRKHGPNYCGICPDGYACASGKKVI